MELKEAGGSLRNKGRVKMAVLAHRRVVRVRRPMDHGAGAGLAPAVHALVRPAHVVVVSHVPEVLVVKHLVVRHALEAEMRFRIRSVWSDPSIWSDPSFCGGEKLVSGSVFSDLLKKVNIKYLKYLYLNFHYLLSNEIH